MKKTAWHNKFYSFSFPISQKYHVLVTKFPSGGYFARLLLPEDELTIIFAGIGVQCKYLS